MTMRIPGTGLRLERGPQTVEATQLGRQRAEEFAVSGDELQVLLALVHHGRQTPLEVSHNAHVEERKTKSMLNAFVQRGWAVTGAMK